MQKQQISQKVNSDADDSEKGLTTVGSPFDSCVFLSRTDMSDPKNDHTPQLLWLLASLHDTYSIKLSSLSLLKYADIFLPACEHESPLYRMAQ